MTIQEKITKKIGPSKDYIQKNIVIDKVSVYLVFNETLTNGLGIDDFILKSLLQLRKKELNNLPNVLPNTNIKEVKEEEILDYVNQGFLVIVTNKIYASEFRAVLDRGITTIESLLPIHEWQLRAGRQRIRGFGTKQRHDLASCPLADGQLYPTGPLRSSLPIFASAYRERQ